MLNQFKDEFEVKYDSEHRQYLYCPECKTMFANLIAIELGPSELRELHQKIHREANLRPPRSIAE
jgi:hypothetical protein